MDLVNRLITEIQEAEEALKTVEKTIEISEPNSSELVKALRDEFECYVILSGASYDLLRLAKSLAKEPGNEFFVRRLKAEAEKYKKYEVAL